MLERPVSKTCVIGAGPAGLATSIALRRAGYRVTVLDHAKPCIDKACGEGLLPDSIAALSALGVEIPPEVGFPFRGIRFSGARSAVAADFPTGAARGIRRTALHNLLVGAAESCGVTLIWDAKNIALAEYGVVIDGRPLEVDFVVGADGQGSKIRNQAGLDRVFRERKRFGFRRHYRMQPWSSYMELHWAPKCQIYVTPVSREEVCIASISEDPKLRLDEALHFIPALLARLKNAVQVSHDRGALSVSRRLRRVTTLSLALVGDASGSVDAITGEGLGLAFRQAAALVDAVNAGDLTRYEIAHRRLMRRPEAMARLMLLLDRNREVQRRALAALQRHPHVFSSLVGIHTGALSLSGVFSPRLLNFGLSFLAA